MAEGDEAQAEAIRKALSDLASDLSDLAMTSKENASSAPEASQELLDMMAKAAAGDQKAQERLQQMAEQLKQASENKEGQCSGDATAMMKQLMQAMQEGQAMQSACGSMSTEEAMAALSGMAQCESGAPGLGNKSEGKSNGGRPGSAQETETDTTFERLAGDPSEGEVLLRMKERRAAPVGESTLDPVEARRVALAGWEAAGAGSDRSPAPRSAASLPRTLDWEKIRVRRLAWLLLLGCADSDPTVVVYDGLDDEPGRMVVAQAKKNFHSR